MRNAVVVALAGCLVATLAFSQVAEAKAKKSHKATGTYASPAVGTAGAGGSVSCSQSEGLGCVEFATKVIDHFATFSIKDSSGQPVLASWGQDYDGDGLTDAGGDFCGKTSGPQSIRGGVQVVVFLWEGPGVDPACAGFATQGTVVAKFIS